MDHPAEQSVTSVRRSRDDAFKDLLMKLSHNMGEEDVHSLLMVGDLRWHTGPGTQPPKAITVLQALRNEGKFSPSSCANLGSILRRILRYDLNDLVHQYMDSYTETATEKKQTRKSPILETSTEAGMECVISISTEAEMVHPELPTVVQEEDTDRTKFLPLQRIASSPETLTKSHHNVDDHEKHTNAHNNMTVDRHAVDKLEKIADKRNGYKVSQPVNNYKSMPDVRTQNQPLFATLPKKSTTSTVSQNHLLESQEMIESQSAAISGESIQSFHSSASQQPPTQISISIGNSNGPVDIHISDNSGNSSLSPPPVTVTNNVQQQSRRSSTSSTGSSSSHPPVTHKQNKHPVPTTKSAVVERASAMCSTLHEVPSSEEQLSDDFRKDSESPAALRQSDTNHSPRQSRSPTFPNDCTRSHVPGKNKTKSNSDAQESPKEGRKWKKFLRRSKKGRELTTKCCWVVEKSLLGKYIWDHEHQFGYIKYPKTLPIDLGQGDFNPYLSLFIYPFGLFSDQNTNVTLQVKIVMPDNCPPLPITDTFNLSWEICIRKLNACTGRLFACSKKPLKIPFDRGMIYVHNFLPHDRIKQCRCDAFEIQMHTKYCSATGTENFAQDLESGVTPSGGSVTEAKLMKFKIGNDRFINIAQEIGDSYQAFGHLLLNENADKLITHNLLHNGTPTTINKEILHQWLIGNGKGQVHWRTLIDTLRAIELASLADVIERNLQLN